LTGPVLRLQGVERRFAGPAGGTLALQATDLAVGEGEFVTILGPSGCGKSTLFNIIGGLMAADSGTILVDGHPIDGSHRDIGMVFQEESVFPWRSVLDNVALPLEVAGMARRERHEKAMRFIELVGLAGFEHRRPAELSGGMRQRTALARTLASEPRILLMDEPFAALDALTRRRMQQELLALWERLRFTLLFVTHSIEEALVIGSRVGVLSPRPGRLRAESNAHDFGFDSPGGAGFQAAAQRIHDLLFDEAVAA
jgi:NitT/TauT family transport system ATP-binding protein